VFPFSFTSYVTLARAPPPFPFPAGCAGRRPASRSGPSPGSSAPCARVAKNLAATCGKHRVRQHIFIRAVATVQRHRRVPQLLPLGLQQVRRPVSIGCFFACLAACDHVAVARPDRLAVVAQHQVGELAGEHLVAAHQHIEHGLGSDDLAGRRDQRRIARILAHPRHFRPVPLSCGRPRPAASAGSPCWRSCRRESGCRRSPSPRR
jgi:hypothetical protein